MQLVKLKKNIKNKSAKIGVVGLGYVGLPLAMAFAQNGFSVTGIDLSEDKVKKLNQGKSYILDVPSSVLGEVVRRKAFKAVSDYRAIASLDVVIICVPTPLNKKKEPDISYIIDATKKIAQFMKKGQLIILESTTYPGTTEEEVLPQLKRSGLEPEKDFFLVFSPERVDPGNQSFDTVSIPKVIGGIGKRSTEAAKALYSSVMRGVIEVSSAKTAEMTKLLENSFRSVNIAFINEMAVIAHHLGVDIWEVIEAAKTKPFGFMAFYPGPGTGGHCLPIDPLYLSWKSKSHGFEAEMIELASKINKEMPGHVAKRAAHLLNQNKIPLKKASVLILGVAYKKDIDDPREAPALDVIDNLLEEDARVSYSDPFIAVLNRGRLTLRSQSLTPAIIKKQDCVVILTDHSSVDYGMVVKNAKMILDTRNVLRNFKHKENVHFL